MGIDRAPIPQHYETILHSIADGVFTVDQDWRITFFNKAAEQITRVPQAEAIGQICYEVFRANVCEAGCVLRQTLTAQKTIWNMPIYIIRADKKRIPISVSTCLLKNAAGQVVGGVETFRDLSAIDELRRQLKNKQRFADIISRNEKMLRLFSILPQIAQSESTVLIEGASGTGKELFARAIHNNSPRKKGRFVAVNCGALPETLVEAELFGYVAGAFTDAKKDNLGRFALAQDGTIFLDEIGDVSHAVQIRLLRVLEQKVYEPLGSSKPVQANARIVAATHRNLEELVQQGRFREDLFYRINVIKLSLPPLLQRREDIPFLVDHFVTRFNHLAGKEILGLSPEAMAALKLHNWPGNVRELENALEHAFVLCQNRLIQLEHLPSHLIPANHSLLVPTGLTLKEVEKRTIAQALQRHQWRKVATARELGIDKNTLRRKIKRLGILQPL